jgi:hypothetical protein
MAVRSPTSAALGRSCWMRAPRPAELSPTRGDGTPLALAALVSDVKAGGGSAAPGDDGARVALGLLAAGAATCAGTDAGADTGTSAGDGTVNGASAGAGTGELSAAAVASLAIGDEAAQECATPCHPGDNTNFKRQTARQAYCPLREGRGERSAAIKNNSDYAAFVSEGSVATGGEGALLLPASAVAGALPASAVAGALSASSTGPVLAGTTGGQASIVRVHALARRRLTQLELEALERASADGLAPAAAARPRGQG